jgi:hypothetical protein
VVRYRLQSCRASIGETNALSEALHCPLVLVFSPGGVEEISSPLPKISSVLGNSSRQVKERCLACTPSAYLKALPKSTLLREKE